MSWICRRTVIIYLNSINELIYVTETFFVFVWCKKLMTYFTVCSEINQPIEPRFFVSPSMKAIQWNMSNTEIVRNVSKISGLGCMATFCWHFEISNYIFSNIPFFVVSFQFASPIMYLLENIRTWNYTVAWAQKW